MKRPSTTFKRFVLVVALFAAAALAGSTGVGAFTVVTRDGHIIQTQARPEIRGLEAFMRLMPRGQLAVIQEEQIDWDRTDAANPTPTVIAIPSDTKMAEAPKEQAPGKPIELKIVGTPTPKELVAPPDPEKTADQKPPAAGDGSSDKKKAANAQEAIAKLQKEYSEAQAARAQEEQKKAGYEAELAKVQSKNVGYASQTNSSQVRMRELEQLISDSSAKISQLESRMNEIRSEAVQLGGVID